jgi:hypothetical protein
MRESRWKRFQQLSLEGLVIVVSVLVALVVEGYRLEREEIDEVAEALAALEAEVQANLEELVAFEAVVTERHARLVAITSEIDGSQPFSEYVGRFGGYRVPDLDVSAWARISSDPVANRIAPERLREAFLLYDYLTYLTRLDDQIIQFAFSPGYHDPDEAKVSHRVAEAILSQQIDYAEDLAPLHRAFLEQ